MRFIKCLSVLPFAVGDREGCRMAPVEAVLIFSGSIKPNVPFSSASTFASHISLHQQFAEAVSPAQLQVPVLYMAN